MYNPLNPYFRTITRPSDDCKGHLNWGTRDRLCNGEPSERFRVGLHRQGRHTRDGTDFVDREVSHPLGSFRRAQRNRLGARGGLGWGGHRPGHVPWYAGVSGRRPASSGITFSCPPTRTSSKMGSIREALCHLLLLAAHARDADQHLGQLDHLLVGHGGALTCWHGPARCGEGRSRPEPLPPGGCSPPHCGRCRARTE